MPDNAESVRVPAAESARSFAEYANEKWAQGNEVQARHAAEWSRMWALVALAEATLNDGADNAR